MPCYRVSLSLGLLLVVLKSRGFRNEYIIIDGKLYTICSSLVRVFRQVGLMIGLVSGTVARSDINKMLLWHALFDI